MVDSSAEQGMAGPDSGGRPDLLAAQLGDLARTLQGRDDTESLLDDVVAAAVDLIPGVDEGSISMVVGHAEIISRNPSGELPRVVDELQAETGEGPCLDAVYTEQTVRVPDMAHEPRWPRFAARAAAAGAASMLSFQLFAQGDNLGALNLYARRPFAFDEESEHVGLLFATHAAIALVGSQQRENLERGLATRDLIGQAKGILMERYRISGQRAFVLLSQASQQSGIKLRDLAEQLNRTGDMPGSLRQPPRRP